MIEWDSKYELGINSIDDQHKELIAITGRLSDLLINAVDGEDIYDGMIEIIEELTDYTKNHFAFEERLFEQLGYILKESHMEEHRKLIMEIEKLDFEDIDENQIVYGKKILKFLITWVFNHISGTDFLYKEFFIANNVQ